MLEGIRRSHWAERSTDKCSHFPPLPLVIIQENSTFVWAIQLHSNVRNKLRKTNRQTSTQNIVQTKWKEMPEKTAQISEKHNKHTSRREGEEKTITTANYDLLKRFSFVRYSAQALCVRVWVCTILMMVHLFDHYYTVSWFFVQLLLFRRHGTVCSCSEKSHHTYHIHLVWALFSTLLSEILWIHSKIIKKN